MYQYVSIWHRMAHLPVQAVRVAQDYEGKGCAALWPGALEGIRMKPRWPAKVIRI